MCELFRACLHVFRTPLPHTCTFGAPFPIILSSKSAERIILRVRLVTVPPRVLACVLCCAPPPACSGKCHSGYYCEEGSTSPTQYPCGNATVFCVEGSSVPLPVYSTYAPPSFPYSFTHFPVLSSPVDFSRPLLLPNVLSRATADAVIPYSSVSPAH